MLAGAVSANPDANWASTRCFADAYGCCKCTDIEGNCQKRTTKQRRLDMMEINTTAQMKGAIKVIKQTEGERNE